MYYIIQNPDRNNGKLYFWDSEKQVFQPNFRRAFGYFAYKNVKHEYDAASEIFGKDDVRIISMDLYTDQRKG